ncbi:hypothetical protein KIL84_010040 [Mauremys mutica]|uniref:Uncharacterized protein n=1 Tax=Mauremys mutica TaxID=74926 RepID=A0A9D3XMP3_9SAUR|nr:hypothetical protein KIL84_010040 [Mauremys mutica]
MDRLQASHWIIARRKNSPGTDIFHNDNGDCIIRSDLGCYLQTKDLLDNIQIQKLHPSCEGGPYRVVTDLSMDENPQVFDLNPRCCGGEHYGRTGLGFFIIFQNQGEIQWVNDLRTAADEQTSVLPLKCCKGLYYFGIQELLTLIKVDEK